MKTNKRDIIREERSSSEQSQQSVNNSSYRSRFTPFSPARSRKNNLTNKLYKMRNDKYIANAGSVEFTKLHLGTDEDLYQKDLGLNQPFDSPKSV